MKSGGQKTEARGQRSETGPPPSALRPRSSGMSPLLIIVSAPSGGGKTTLCRHLLAARPELTRAITCTTRAPRAGEKDGVDYYFMDAASFEKRVRAGDFLEHAAVHGHSYGTLKAGVLNQLRRGRDVLLNVDVQGAAAIRKQARRNAGLRRALVTIFLVPRSLAVLEERLRRRATDSAATIKRRLGAARREIAQWKHFDYLLVSGSMTEDLRRALAIVEAERMRAARASAKF
jgi:guanylate kinase